MSGEWIEHDGKGMPPISVNQLVEVKFPDGSGPEGAPMPAGFWHNIGGSPSSWIHRSSAAPIVAYRIIPDPDHATSSPQ